MRQTRVVIELRAGAARCTISPDDGGRVASLHVGDTQLLIERPHDGSEPDPMSWGCYPMAPWAGRVRRGRFSFHGEAYQLPLNLAPHAIHGTVFTRSWHVELVEADAVTMSCTFGPSWPFGGFVSQRIALIADALISELAITATSHDMPAQIGWHPWFVKPQSANLRFANMYIRDADGLPTGILVEPSDGPWDDCFIEPTEPLELRYDTGANGALAVTISSDCDHWVVYDQPHHATCVEPQSGPPDGFNLLTGSQPMGPRAATVVSAGQTLQRIMRIGWQNITESEPDGASS